MAKATRVHSTPRRTASKIKPTGPSNAFDDASRNEALARAFVSLEPDICDLDRMTRLCLRLSGDGEEAQEFLGLCLERLEVMAGEFKKQYYAMYGTPARQHRRQGGAVMAMDNNIVTFPGFSPKRGRANTVSSEPQEEASRRADWRSRERIQEDIEMHIAARVAYGKAVAWEAAAESENLPPAQIEEARQRTREGV